MAIVYESGWLHVEGTDGDDAITVSSTGTRIAARIDTPGREPVALEAERGGATPSSAIVSGAGDDAITVAGDYEVLIVDGVDGDDTIDTSQAGYRIGIVSADAGNDTIRLGGEADLVAGGEGDERITGGDGTDYVNAEPGEDVVDVGDEDSVLEELAGGGPPRFSWIALAVMAAIGGLVIRSILRR